MAGLRSRDASSERMRPVEYLRAFGPFLLLNGIGAAALCFFSLTAQLGYEHAVAAGVLVGLLSGAAAVQAVGIVRRRAWVLPFFALLGRVARWNVPLLLIPWALATLNLLRVPNCEYQTGLAFYALIPGVSWAIGTGLGLVAGLVAPTRLRGWGLWLGWVVATGVYGLYTLFAQPPKFLYHGLAGYLAGPIYDAKVEITGTTLLARFLSLWIAVVGLSTAGAGYQTWGARWSGRLLWERRSSGSVRAGLGVVWGVLLVLIALRGPLGIRPTRADLQRLLSAQAETPHFRIRSEPGAIRAEELRLFAEDAEFRYHQLARLFGWALPGKVDVYLYTTPDQKRRWIGARYTQLADPFHRELHLNRGEFPHGVLKHELAHLFAAEFHPWMKISLAPALLEGVAVAADWERSTMTPHEWSAAMLRVGRLPSLSRLVRVPGFWTLSSSRAYLASGSFVRWLWEQYGLEAIRTAYPFGNLKRATGRSVKALEAEWRQFLESVPLSKWMLRRVQARLTRPGVVEQICPHDVAALEAEAWRRYRSGDYAGARERFLQLAGIDSNRLEWRWRAVQMDLAAGRWARAERALRDLLRIPRLSPSLRERAWEALGDAAWRRGDRSHAARAYERAMLLATDAGTLRGLWIKREGLRRSPTLQKALQRYFGLGVGQTVRLYRAVQCVREDPDWAGGHYLLGIQLFAAELWEESDRAFQRALRRGLPPLLAAEARRRQGIARYRLGDLAGAREAFSAAWRLRDQKAWRLLLGAWIARAEWRRSVPPISTLGARDGEGLGVP